MSERSPLRGRVAIANARVAYRHCQTKFARPEWERLHANGANAQRPLSASTGTKNPAYSDVLYISELIAPDAINTMPEQTLRAFADHGEVTHTLAADPSAAQRTLADARRAGIDLGAVTAELEREGVQAFCDSYQQLLHCIEAKLDALTPTGSSPHKRFLTILIWLRCAVGFMPIGIDTNPSPEEPSSPAPSGPSPDTVRSYRYQLTPGEDVIDPATWAGSVPQVNGIAPRVRVGRHKWFNLLWLLPIGLFLLIIAIAVAKGLRGDAFMQRFIRRYPGTDVASPAAGTVGFPAWVDLQHFFNLFLMIFIIRAGAQILSDHPRLYWTRHSTPGRDWFRIQRPVPADPLWTAKQDSISLPGQVGLPGLRHSIGLARWWHLSADALWLINGVVFYVLLFASGRWQRLVPTSWDVFPNALSTLVQYLSLNWPGEHGWVAYNGLQLIAYFVTVFIAAPLALITGLGMSPALSTRFKRISKVFSIQTARSLHFLVLVWFLIFIVLHVTFVFTTGLLANLDHIYAGRTGDGWIGFWLFAASMVIVITGWVAATPFTIRHPRVVQRVGQAIVGPVQHLFEHVDPTPGEYSEKDISPYFWHNGQYPDSDEYKALFDGDFAEYRLRINGLVANPVELDLAQLRALPRHEQITQHFCIQGWSGVAKWGGVSMRTIVDLVQPQPEAKWVVFYSLGEGADKGVYYDAHPIEHMSHHLTMLAYDMNDQPLPFGHGAPLRLRNEIELGFKQVKWIKGIEFVAHYSEIGAGYGGYNQDHEFFGYRQSI